MFQNKKSAGVLAAALFGLTACHPGISHAVTCCSNVVIVNFGPNIKAHTENAEYATDATVANLANGWIHTYKPLNHKNTEMFTPQGYEQRAVRMNNGLIKSGRNGKPVGCPAVKLDNIKDANAKPIGNAWEEGGALVACTIERQWREKLKPMKGWGN